MIFDTKAGIFLICVACGCGGIGGYAIGFRQADTAVRQSAYAAGVGEWTIEKFDRRVWRWSDLKPQIVFQEGIKIESGPGTITLPWELEIDGGDIDNTPLVDLERGHWVNTPLPWKGAEP